MIYLVIHNNRSKYRVKKMCRILKVSRSGFNKWSKRKNNNKSSADLFFKAQIKAIYDQSRQTYGYLRITQTLKNKGFVINKKKVARLMQEMGISGLQTKRFRPKTTLSNHNYPISPDLINRNFQLKEKNQVWVSDITYIKVGNRWYYLCSVIDLFNREVVGWSFEGHMRTDMVVRALGKAVKKRGTENLKNLIFHSDRGSQYASNQFREYLQDLSIRSSMSAKGNCYDNAVAESFFATLKREEVRRKNYNNIQQAKIELFKYIEVFYNRQRVHSTLNYKTPLEVAA